MTKIAKIEIFKHRYDMGGYRLSYGSLDEVFPVIVSVSDADGFVGWGEANPQRPFTNENADDVIGVLRDELAPELLRRGIEGPDEAQAYFDEERADDNLMAKGALNIALMDLRGKQCGLPIHEMLGGAIRRTMLVSHPLNNGSAEDDIRVIEDKLAQGYRHYMLKMGEKSARIPDEVRRVATLQARYGDRITIKVDPNTGWSRAEAHEFLRDVPDYPIFVEQPVDKYDLDGMAELQRSTSLLLSVDESLTGMASARDIIAKGAARVFSVKISKNGGIINSLAVARLAAECGIVCYPNSMAEGGITQAASLQLTATLGNLVEAGGSFRSVLRLKGDVTNFASFIDNGVVSLPDGPGLGIEVDEARLRGASLVSHVIERG
jgi:L-alanine-DL-glutamate epimerase-like enolase superfamily enzyme